MDDNIHINTERVIAEVRKRPAIWNKSHEMYNYFHAKTQLWAEVFEAVVPEYKDDDAAKKLEIELSTKMSKNQEKAVRQRWKTARDAYIRSKSSAGSKRKAYIYCDHMVFLDENSSNDVKVTIGSPQTTSDWDPLNTYNQDSSTTSEQSIEETKPDIELLSNLATETTDPTDQNCSSKNIFIDVDKRKPAGGEDSQTDLLNVFKDGKHINDDLAFFVSLLPITEQFTTQQKLVFRSEILKKAIEISNTHNPYDEPSSSTPPKRIKRK